MNKEWQGPTLGVCFGEKAYRESKDLTEERQGQTLDVHFREALPYRESKNYTKEWKGPTQGVHLRF